MQLLSSLAATGGQSLASEMRASLVSLVAQDYRRPMEYDTEDSYSPQRRRSRYRDEEQSNIFKDLLGNQKQLGATLLGIGLLLTVMGMMLFFEGNLLRLGNIGIVAGTFLLIGPARVSGFFLKETRLQATIITAVGILLVFFGRPKLGLLIEIFGLLNLFGNMFPMLWAVGKSIPGVGDVLSAFEGPQKGPRRGRYGGGEQQEPERRYNPEF